MVAEKSFGQTAETRFRHNARDDRLHTMNAPMNTLSGMHLTALRRAVSCPVLDGDSAEYDEARRVWNGQVDRRPSAIIRATSIADVMQTVRFCREQGIKASVRGGGHSAAGKAVADGALMIDLSLMREVQVEGGRKRAVVQGGATWGEFDRACEAHKLATTGGVISSTGVCGLTLGWRHRLVDGQTWAELRQRDLGGPCERGRRSYLRRARRKMRICSGRFAVVAGTSGSSRRSNFSCMIWTLCMVA